MLEGSLDAIQAGGYIDGWAYETDSPFRPVTVALLADGLREIAWGTAQGYREDLVAAGIANGWCAFRLKLAEWPVLVPWRSLTLVERTSGTVIFERESLPYVAEEPRAPGSIPEVLAADPTSLQSLHQLRGCNALFSAYIAAQGLDAFVRTAYGYLLGRPADAAGCKSYRNHARANPRLTPYDLMMLMSDSDEYRSQPRQHCAPPMSAFPFRVGG